MMAEGRSGSRGQAGRPREGPVGGLPGFPVLGVRVHQLDPGSVMVVLESFLASGVPHQVVTVNPEFLVQAQDDPAFARVLNSADLAVADGVGLQWAARLLGQGRLHRVPGVDLVESLAAIASQRGHRLFLLGAGPGVAAAAAGALCRRYPKLQVAGAHEGSPDPAGDDSTVALVRQAHADILLVAFGAPGQDTWIHRNLPALGVALAIGVGGSFDYLSGRVRRAPAWMRKAGLEWLFRLIMQPWRWRRMLRLPRFLFLVLKQRIASSRPAGSAAGAGISESGTEAAG